MSDEHDEDRVDRLVQFTAKIASAVTAHKHNLVEDEMFIALIHAASDDLDSAMKKDGYSGFLTTDKEVERIIKEAEAEIKHSRNKKEVH